MSYRVALGKEIDFVEGQIREMGKRVDAGTIPQNGPEMIVLRKKLLKLKRTLAAFDAGALPI